MKLYKCDPTKNTRCAKTCCFINGGDCHLTTKKEFRKETKMKKLLSLFNKERIQKGNKDEEAFVFIQQEKEN